MDPASDAPTTIVPVTLVSPFRMDFPEQRAVPIRSTTLVSLTGTTLGNVEVGVATDAFEKTVRSSGDTGFYRLTGIPVNREGITFNLATSNRVGDRAGSAVNDGKLPIEGFTEPGLEVVLRVSNSSVIRTAVADTIGRFSFPDVPFNEGTNTITLETSNSEGFLTRAVVDFTFDTRPPVITYFDTVQDRILDTPVVNISGESDEPFNRIQYIDPETGASVDFVNTGQIFNMPNFAFQEGIHSMDILYTDRAGNTSRSILNFEVDSTLPVFGLMSPSAKRNTFDGAYEAHVGNPLEEIRAFTAPGAVVTATFVGAGLPDYTAFADSDGSFAVPPFRDSFGRPVPYAGGINTVSINIRDSAGNVRLAKVNLFLPPPFESDVSLSILSPAEGVSFKAGEFVLPDLGAGILTPQIPVRVISGEAQPYTPLNIPRNLLAAGNARLFEISPDGRPVAMPSGSARFTARRPEFGDTICLPGTLGATYPELRQGPGISVPETLRENLLTVLNDPSCMAVRNNGDGLARPLAAVNLSGGTVTERARVDLFPAGPDNDFVLTAVDAGAAGNSISFAMTLAGGPAQPFSMSVAGSTISVVLATDGSSNPATTVRELVSRINSQAGTLVRASLAASQDAASDPYCAGDGRTVERRRIVAVEWSPTNVCTAGETPVRLAAPLDLITEGVICQSLHPGNCPFGIVDQITRMRVDSTGRVYLEGADLANPRDGVPVQPGDSIVISGPNLEFSGSGIVREVDYGTNSMIVTGLKPPSTDTVIDSPGFSIKIDRNVSFVVSDLVTGADGELHTLAPAVPSRLDVDPDGNPASQNKFTLVARNPGVSAISFEIVDPGLNNPAVGITVAGTLIQAAPMTVGGIPMSTARDLVNAINRDPAASRLVRATLTAPLSVPSVGPLNNGLDTVGYPYAPAALSGGAAAYGCPGGAGCHPKSSQGALAVARLSQPGSEPVVVNVSGGHGSSATGKLRFAELLLGDPVRLAGLDVQAAPAPDTVSFAGPASLPGVDGFHAGARIEFTSGALQGEIRTVTGYTGASRTFTVSPPLPSAPAAGSFFTLTDYNGSVKFTAVAPGVSGTQASVYLYSSGQPGDTLLVQQLANQLTVRLATENCPLPCSPQVTTTARELADAIRANAQASALLRVSLPPGADGSRTVAPVTDPVFLFLDARRPGSTLRRNFRVLSPSRTGIEIASPPDGFVTAASVVDVSGRLIRNTETRKVVVNGRALQTEKDGRFLFRELPLEPGENVIEAVSIDQNGRSLQARVRIYRATGADASVGITLNGDPVRDGVLGTSFSVSGTIQDGVDAAGRIIAAGTVGLGGAFVPGIGAGDLIVNLIEPSYASLIRTTLTRPTNPTFVYAFDGPVAGTIIPVTAFDGASTITVGIRPPSGTRVALVERNLLLPSPGDHTYLVSGSIGSVLDRQWNQLNTFYFPAAPDPYKIIDVSYLAMKNNLAGAFTSVTVGVPLVTRRPFVRLTSPVWFEGSDGVIAPDWPGATTGTLTSASLFFSVDAAPAGFGTFEDIRVNTGDLVVTGAYQGAPGPNDGLMLSVISDSLSSSAHQIRISTTNGSALLPQSNVSFAVVANQFSGPTRKYITRDGILDVSGFVSDPSAIVVADVLVGDVNTSGLSVGGEQTLQFPDGSFVLNGVDLSEGMNTVYVRAQNRAGLQNLSENQRSLVHYDPRPPAISGLCIPTGTAGFNPNNPCGSVFQPVPVDAYGYSSISVSRQSFELRGFISDGSDGTGVRALDIRIDGQAPDAYNGPTGLNLPGNGAFTILLDLPQGESRVIITATDLAGNTGTVTLFIQTPATPPPYFTIDCFVDQQPLNAAGLAQPALQPYGPREIRCADDEFSPNPNSPVNLRGQPFAAAGSRGPRFGDPAEYNAQNQTDNFGPIPSAPAFLSAELPLDRRLAGRNIVTFEGRGLTRSGIIPTVHVNGDPTKFVSLGEDIGSGDTLMLGPGSGGGSSVVHFALPPLAESDLRAGDAIALSSLNPSQSSNVGLYRIVQCAEAPVPPPPGPGDLPDPALCTGTNVILDRPLPSDASGMFVRLPFRWKSVPIQLPQEGLNAVSFIAEDESGVRYYSVFTVVRDTQPPSVSISGIVNGSETFHASPAVILTDQSIFFGGLVTGSLLGPATVPASIISLERLDDHGEGTDGLSAQEEFVVYASSDAAPFDTVRPGLSADGTVNFRTANLDDADDAAGAPYLCNDSVPGATEPPYQVSAVTQLGIIQASYLVADGSTVAARPARCDFSCNDNAGDGADQCLPGSPMTYRLRVEAHDRVGFNSTGQVEFSIVQTAEGQIGQGLMGLISENPVLTLLLSDPTGLDSLLLDQLSISGVLYGQNLRLSELLGSPYDTPVTNPLAHAFEPSRSSLGLLLSELLHEPVPNALGGSIGADGADVVRLLLDLGAGDDLLTVLDTPDLQASYTRANYALGGPVVEGDPSHVSRFLQDLLADRETNPAGFRVTPGPLRRAMPLVAALLEFQDSFRIRMDTAAPGRNDTRLSGTDLTIDPADYCTLYTGVLNGFFPSQVNVLSESNVQPGDRVTIRSGRCTGTSRVVESVNFAAGTIQTACAVHPGGPEFIDLDTVRWPDGNAPYDTDQDCAAAAADACRLGGAGCDFTITPGPGQAFVPVIELVDILSYANKDGRDVLNAASPLDGVLVGGENDLLQALVHLNEESFLMSVPGELSIVCDAGSPCPIDPDNPADRDALDDGPTFQALADLLYQLSSDDVPANGSEFIPQVLELLRYLLQPYDREAVNPRAPAGASRTQALLFVIRDLLENTAASSGLLSEPVLNRPAAAWAPGDGPLRSQSGRQNTRLNLLLRSGWFLTEPMNFRAQYDYGSRDGQLEASLDTAMAALIPVLWQLTDDPDDNPRGIPLPPGSLPQRSPLEKLLEPAGLLLRDERTEDVILALADLLDPGTGVSDLTAFADHAGIDLGRQPFCDPGDPLRCTVNYPFLTSPEQSNPFTVNPPLLRVISQMSGVYLDVNRNEVRDPADQTAIDAAGEALNVLFRRIGIQTNDPDILEDGNQDPEYGTVRTAICNENYFNGEAPVSLLLTRLPAFFSTVAIDPREKDFRDDVTVTDPDPANLNRSPLRIALDALVDDPDVNEPSLPDDIDEYPLNPLADGALPVGTRGHLGGDGLTVSRRSLDQISEALNSMARFGFDEEDRLTSIFANCTSVAAGCPKNKGYPYPFSQARLLSNLRRANDIAFQLDGPFQVGSGVTGIVRFEQSLLREALKNIGRLTKTQAVDYAVLLISRISDDISPINGSTTIVSPEDVAKGAAAARVFADPDNDGDPLPDGLLQDFVPIAQALVASGLTDQIVDLLRAVRACGVVTPEEDVLNSLKDIRGGELLYAQEDLLLSLLDPQSGAVAGNCPADAVGLDGRGNRSGAFDGNPLVGDTDILTPGVQTRSNSNSGVAVAGDRLRLIEADTDGTGPDTGRVYAGIWQGAIGFTVSGAATGSTFSGASIPPSITDPTGYLVTFTSGALLNQSRVVDSFATPQFTVSPPFPSAPAAGDTFQIVAPSESLYGSGIGPGASLCAVVRQPDEPGGYLETCAEVVSRPAVNSGEAEFNDSFGGNPAGVNAVFAADCSLPAGTFDTCSFRIRQMREPFNGCFSGNRIGPAPVQTGYGPGLGMTLGAFSPIGLEVRGQVETAGGASSFTGDSNFAARSDAAYTGGTVRFGSEVQQILSFDALSRTFTTTPFTAAPSAGDTVIVNRPVLEPNVWRDGYLDLLLRTFADLGAGLNQVDTNTGLGTCAGLNGGAFTADDERYCQNALDRIETLANYAITQDAPGQLSIAGKLLLGGEGLGYVNETPVQALLNDPDARQAIANLLALQGLVTVSADNPAIPAGTPQGQDGRDRYPCNAEVTGTDHISCQFSQTDWTPVDGNLYEGNGVNDGTDYALLALEGVLRTLGRRTGSDGYLNANPDPVSPRFEYSDDPGILLDFTADLIEAGYVTRLLPGLQIAAESFDSVPQYDSTDTERIRDLESSVVDQNNPRFNSDVLVAINRRVTSSANGDESGSIWADNTYPDGFGAPAATVPPGQSAIAYGVADAPDVTEGPAQVLARTAKLALDEWAAGIGKRRSRVVSAERLVAQLAGAGPRPSDNTLDEALTILRAINRDFVTTAAHDRSIDILAPVMASAGDRGTYRPGTNRTPNDLLTDLLALWIEDPTDCDRPDHVDPAGATLGVQRGSGFGGRPECTAVTAADHAMFDDADVTTDASQHDRILNRLFRQSLFRNLRPHISGDPDSLIVRSLPFLGRAVGDSSKPVVDRPGMVYSEYTPGVAVVDALVSDLRTLVPDAAENRLDPLLTDDLNRNGSLRDNGLAGTGRSRASVPGTARYSVFDDFGVVGNLQENELNEVILAGRLINLNDNIVYDCSVPNGTAPNVLPDLCTGNTGAPLTSADAPAFRDRRIRIGFTATDDIVTLGNVQGLNAAVLDGLADLIASSNAGRAVNNQLPRTYSSRRFAAEAREADLYTERYVAPANPVSGDFLLLMDALGRVLFQSNF